MWGLDSLASSPGLGGGLMPQKPGEIYLLASQLGLT
jgi:hypothetical protein